MFVVVVEMSENDGPAVIENPSDGSIGQLMKIGFLESLYSGEELFGD